jgi:hypothetical protein
MTILCEVNEYCVLQYIFCDVILKKSAENHIKSMKSSNNNFCLFILYFTPDVTGDPLTNRLRNSSYRYINVINFKVPQHNTCSKQI